MSCCDDTPITCTSGHCSPWGEYTNKHDWPEVGGEMGNCPVCQTTVVVPYEDEQEVREAA